MQLSFEPEARQWRKVLFMQSIVMRGIDIPTAAKVFGFALSTAYRLVKAYREQGEAGVWDKRYGPRRNSMDKLMMDTASDDRNDEYWDDLNRRAKPDPSQW